MSERAAVFYKLLSGRRFFAASFLFVASALPALACSVTPDPARSDPMSIWVDVRAKKGERCVLVEFDRADGASWFPALEKRFSLERGRHGKLIYDYRVAQNPKQARNRYVYVSPPDWTGQDVVIISSAMTKAQVRFNITVEP